MRRAMAVVCAAALCAVALEVVRSAPAFAVPTRGEMMGIGQPVATADQIELIAEQGVKWVWS